MAGIFWGLPYFFIAVAIESFSTPSVVFARTFLGALVLIPYAALTGGLKPALKAWPYVLIFAVVEMVGPWFLITEALNGISSGLAGLLVGTVPFFVVAILAIFFKDRRALQPRPLIGMVVGFIGVAVLVGVDSITGAVEPFSVLMIIAAAIGYAIAPILANIKLSDVPTAGVIGLSMVIVATLYSPFAVPNIGAELASASSNAIGSLVVLGLVCSAAAFVIFFKLIKVVGPAKASLITYLNTAVALTLGTVFLNEPVTTGLLVGLPLIAVGLYLSGGARNKRDIPETAA